jgi:ribosomal protein S27AE
MSVRQVRYLCGTCGIEFVNGGWILVNNHQSVWREEDGCPRCRSAVQKIAYDSSVPGLDIPLEFRRKKSDAEIVEDFLAGPPPATPITATAEKQPLPLRANDHHGENHILAPDPRAIPPEPPSAVEFWQWI